MKPINASEKSNEKVVYSNLQDMRQKQKPKSNLGQFFRAADIRRVFSKGDATNDSYNLYTIAEVIHDTIPSHRLNYLPEKNNQNLLLPTKISLDQNNQFMKELHLIKKYKTLLMELSEDQMFEKHAKQSRYCSGNTLLPYEYEFTCVL